jgi:hypothetical protein
MLCELPQGLGGKLATLEAGEPFRRKEGKRGLVRRDPLRLQHETSVPPGNRKQNERASASESSPISPAAIFGVEQLAMSDRLANLPCEEPELTALSPRGRQPPRRRQPGLT